MRLGRPILLTIALLAMSVAPSGMATDHRDPDAPCLGTTADAIVEDVSVLSGGETVRGCFAYPASGKADVHTLVVFAHGLGWTVQAGWTGHMVEVVERAPGTAAVAVNYRDNFGFPTLMGAEDTIRATLQAKAALPNVERVVLLGVSMGAAVSGTAIHLAPSMNGGEGLYDHWIDVEGVSNLFETYSEARAVGYGVSFAAAVADGIERDAGGTPWEVPEAYAYRSPALNADAMAAAGLQSAVVIHGVNDGMVPYDQGREMATALLEAGVPVEMHTVTRGDAGHTSGTTPTAHAIPPAQDPNEQHLHLTGHASEGDRDHVVMDTAMERLVALLNGDAVGTYGESVRDDGPLVP